MTFKVSKGAKIRNRYNQVTHLTQDTNGKVTNSQLDPRAQPFHVKTGSGHDVFKNLSLENGLICVWSNMVT